MKTLVGIALIAILGSAASQPEKAATRQQLHDVFAAAVAHTKPSFSSMTTSLKQEWAATINISSWNSSCLGTANNLSALSTCLHKFASKCLSLKDVTSLFNISLDQSLSSEDVARVSPALIYSLLSCDDKQLLEMNAVQNSAEKGPRPTAETTWGYSLLFVTLINVSSLLGVVVIPCMKMRIYKIVLMYMVALAVGTLAGSGLFFLIPEAFGFTHADSLDHVWKSATVMGGIYLFYVTEKIMRMISGRRKNTKRKQTNELATKGAFTSSFRRSPLSNSIQSKDPTQGTESVETICSTETSTDYSIPSTMDSEILNSSNNTTSNGGIDETALSIVNNGFEDLNVTGLSEKPANNGRIYKLNVDDHSTEIAPVAYMVIFGDALHNFIDGLSIGSAFTKSTLTGVSVCVAVLCEELPHELGDFAILLTSGMHYKKAMMYNFLSSCTCYAGTIVGILLGENIKSHEWVFALAGGMFLYISLADMMPEMNTAADSEVGKQFGEKKTFLLQNCGLLTGFAAMLLFALYGRYISFDSE